MKNLLRIVNTVPILHHERKEFFSKCSRKQRSGTVITDYNTHAEYMDPDQMIRAGGSLNLIQDMQPSSSGSRFNASHRVALRNATHDILYTVANSCAMNGYDASIKYGTAPAYWKIAVYVLNGVAVLGLGIFGFFSIRHSVKVYHEEKTSE